MQFTKLLSTIPLLLLLACADPKVDSIAIDQARNETFRIDTIRIPCDLQRIPTLPSYTTKTQRKMLRAIDHKDILQTLTDIHGLKFSSDIDLDSKSYPMRPLGLLSNQSGRCTYYVNQKGTANENVVNIEYLLNAKFYEFKPTVAKFSYKVDIKSGRKTLAVHVGHVKTFEYSDWLTEDDLQAIVDSAYEVSAAVKRDLTK